MHQSWNGWPKAALSPRRFTPPSLLAITLTMVLAQAQTVLEPVEQGMAVSLVVIVVCPFLYHLHPHQRDLREFVASAREERESAAGVSENGCRT